MRRTIRLTGRRQLPTSCANVRLKEVGDGRVLTFAIAEPAAFRNFPQSAHLTLKLVENKQMELLDFGALGSPKAVVDLKNNIFGDPSCQLRVAATGDDHLGLLLGSTKPWRLSSNEEPQQGSVRGILRFQPKNIAPRAWKLDIQENAHPIVLVDERIPDPKTWAKNNPVFIAAVLPSIVQLVFDDILSHQHPADVEWMSDWLRWADSLMPGYPPPQDHGDRVPLRDWIERLIETFCLRHRLSDRIVDQLTREAAA
jgi:hypothetical protein